MANNLDLLIQNQKLCFEKIRTLCANYKKDSASRKTADYLQKRLALLEDYWYEFQNNDEELQPLKSEAHTLDYFAEDVFSRTKTLYDETKQSMRALQLAQSVATPRKATPQPTKRIEDVFKNPVPGPSVTNTEVPAESQELMRLQLLNFKAIEKTISKINVYDTEEKWELEDNLAILKSRWQAIDKIHWELDSSMTDDTSVYQVEYSKWERKYDELKKEINKKLWAGKHNEKSTPQIDIPVFDGNYNKWVSFRDLYTETIHNSNWLTKSQKMQHLKSKLKGEPEKLVQHLNISADNYDSCWDILQNRYENKRLLFSSYVNTLLNLPTIQSASANNLKKMHDTLLECVNGLTNLGLDVSTWDPLLVHLLLPKLDAATYTDYVLDMPSPRALPILSDFLNFLEAKFMALETMTQSQTSQKQQFPPKKQTSWPLKQNYSNDKGPTNFKKHEKWSQSYYASFQSCPLCKKEHTLMKCTQFLNMDIATRNENVNKLEICRNCLFSHNGKECMSTKTCKVCQKGHHTLIHMDKLPLTHNSSTPPTANNVTSNDTEVLLTTVQLMVKNAEGNYVTLRALLDQGSQVSLITESAAQLLRIKRRKLSAVISGIGKSLGNSKGIVTLECKAIHSNFTFTTELLIMNKLVNNLPSSPLTTTKWEYLQNLKLADPHFHVPGPIDILLGADIYSLIIQEGVIKQDNNSPVAQHTKLGWILCGNISKTFNCFVTLNELEDINKFWEVEEINGDHEMSSSDDYCEKFYKQTTERLSTGQYVVRMPLKENIHEKLGQSRPRAVAQFLQLERKMSRLNHFAKLYKEFIAEYIELGHMTPATKSMTGQLQVFLPHHGVIREESTSTKLRTVFNASMKTDTDYSLNDMMEKGPNLQKDILLLIIKWRCFKYALTADIEKMFRAIYIHPDQRSLQKIIWRSSPQDRLQEMELCTVTYGTKAAPFLAMRTLQRLADDEGHAFPLAVDTLRHRIYMDDVITGERTIEGLRGLRKQLYDLLMKGGFKLRKWASNEPAVLQDLNDQQKSQKNVFNFKQDGSTKTLGIGWNTTEDEFCFNWNITNRDNPINYTKRMLLSDISKLYDPLGWLAPIMIKMKLLFQNLWNSNTEWDQPIPDVISNEWEKIRSEITIIKNITIPRWISNADRRVILHGFCDASEKAYGCVIYTVTIDERGEYVTNLLTAKTKVAPLKKKTSVPRLELCGALLLAKLLEKVKPALSDNELVIHCWTDSKVVLAWLQGSDKKWEKYIANRTTIINSIVPMTQWRYVNTKENPADCATRGLLPTQLQQFRLWWEGPQWLKTRVNEDSKKNMTIFSTMEGTILDCHVMQNKNNNNEIINRLLSRCSTMTRATRCLAWVLRYMTRLRNKNLSADDKYLTVCELNYATDLIIKCVQQDHFGDDLDSLRTKKFVSSKSKLLNLTPYIDEKGILRVGGRLSNAILSEESKHPAILPHNSRLTELVIDYAHKQTLHGGVRLTLAQTRHRFWIIGGNRAVKGYLKNCIRCHRFKTSKNIQIMGNLPKARVTPSRPFTHTGVDYTGHVEVKLNKGRGVKTSKGYIAIFICMATKAVHIELVSDLSTNAFLGALKRMCARRGTPKHMYSDNGTNFKGAAKVLHDEFIEYGTVTSSEFFKEISEMQIEWHFLCPYWPSAAGVWEASVKSMKYHLVRVLGEQKLDYEQFTTLLTQIEACMNSRPLCPLTEDVSDLDCLTPGHFLTGSPMMSLPQEPCHENKIDLRNKWKLTECMQQQFWRRWSTEYLHQLQTKSKWLHPKENISVGDLVLVKEDNLPPGKWAMARVLDLHPGNDGYVRVVSLKTQTNILKRPITKLAPLPKSESMPPIPTNDINKRN